MDLLGSPIQPSGRIRDLTGQWTSPNNLSLSWKLQQLIPEDDNWLTATIFDGTVTDYAEDDELSSDVIIASPGSHGLDVRRVPREGEIVNHIQYASGNSVYLDWDRSEDADLSAYMIYRGTQLLLAVSNVVTEELRYAVAPGGGRYSVSGVHDQPVNKWIPVTFPSPGYFTFEGVNYDFLSAGTSVSLPFGITLTFHDDPALYEDFQIFVGIQSWVTLTDQPSGEHTYKVAAIDDAANVSAAIEKKVYVHPIPTQQPEFNEATGFLDIIQGNVDEVRIYSDTLPSGVTLPYIYEEAPIETLLESRLVNLPPGARFYARPVIDGVEHKTLEIYTMPDPGVILGEIGTVTDLEGRPRPGGTFGLNWLYAIPDEDKAVAFRIYSSLDGVNFIPEKVVPRSIVSAVFNEVLEYDTETDTGWATDKEVWFKVVAVDANEVEGTPSNIIMLVADATPPSIPGNLDGLNV